MIVGIKTVRFITVKRHTDPDRGYQAIGIEYRFELHATKGWKYARRRRQLIGSCEKRDEQRALAAGSSVTFKRAYKGNSRRHRDVTPIPITEKMLMRHGWYRRKRGITTEDYLRSIGLMKGQQP